MANLSHVEQCGVNGETERGGRIRKAMWGMLDADGAGVVSKSPEGVTKMMTVVVQ